MEKHPLDAAAAAKAILEARHPDQIFVVTVSAVDPELNREPAPRAAEPDAKSTTDEPLLTVKQVANWLQVRPETVRYAIHAGELPAVRFGNGYRIRPVDRDRWVESSFVQPPPRFDESVPLGGSKRPTKFALKAQEIREERSNQRK